STPHAPRAAEAAAVAAPHAPGELPLDTVYFMGSGRVRGTVIEENPKTGVKVRLLDGTVQTYSREELVRIVYADGSVSSRKVPPAAPPPQAQPQPAFVPPPPPPEDKGPMGPIYIAAGVGVTFVGGDAAAGVPMQNVFDPQAHLSGEIGLRFSPAWAIGVYGDAGGGDVTGPVHDQCQAQMVDCVGYTGRIGVLLRHTWDPATPVAKWLSLGTGWEVGGVTLDHHGGNQPDLFTYTGREYGRIGAGVDFRSNRVVALGMYGSFAIGEYDKYKDPTGTTSLDRRYHTTGELGIRLTLFP
ncbi:MAG TPA: hypothetical protein VLU43_08770, partial [Anaeromyxobacteraceae bacterium]|nr:hypothetical protein [Anaeromyxobacteraceae bacterium]